MAGESRELSQVNEPVEAAMPFFTQEISMTIEELHARLKAYWHALDECRAEALEAIDLYRDEDTTMCYGNLVHVMRAVDAVLPRKAESSEPF